MTTHFLRLLDSDNKEAALDEVLASMRQNQANARHFAVNPQEFNQVPGAPFAYWVSLGVRNLFSTCSQFETTNRHAQYGASTKEDPRFLRCSWEVPENMIGNKWMNFAKGGAYSPFYYDVHLLVNWGNNAKEIEASLLKKYPYLGNDANWVLHRESSYLKPGLTWTNSTTKDISFKPLPSSCLFGHMGPSAFLDNDNMDALLSLLAICNSKIFMRLVALSLGLAEAGRKHYEIGIIQKIPIPEIHQIDNSNLSLFARRSWSLRRRLDTCTETSHAFLLPALFQVQGATIAERIQAWQVLCNQSQNELEAIQKQIDDIAFDLYQIAPEDRAAMLSTGNESASTEGDAEDTEAEDSEEEDSAPGADPVQLVQALLAWCVGVAFGRYDISLATGVRAWPNEPDPFEALPTRSPARTLQGQGRLWLVDEEGHPFDMETQVRQVLEQVFGESFLDLEGECCRILGVRTLRDWLRQPKGFFEYHLKTHSKSRRKAPLWWPLATTSGDWSVWLNAHAVEGDSLFAVLNEVLEPRLQRVRQEIDTLRSEPNPTRAQRTALQDFVDQEKELANLHEELTRVAHLPGKPHLDDGMVIAACPLAKCFRHKAWAKMLSDTYKKLEKGDYDWAHRAKDLWPDRVAAKCRTDKSLAIAHGLEEA